MLPEDVEQVLIGSLLGDGSVCVRHDCKNAIFSEVHSIKQSEYLKWKAGVLYPHFGGRMHTYTVKDTYKMISFVTNVHPVLTMLRELWYPNGRKIVPEKELEKLGTLGLAVWYLDDGTYSYYNHRCKLAINDFKGQEIIIQKWFKDRWNLNPRIISGYQLLFNVKDSDSFLRLITQYIPLSMAYKLGHLHSLNKTRIEDVRRRRLGHQRRYESVEENKIRHRARSSNYYLKNLEECRAYRHEWYMRNRERILQDRRQYYLKNRSEILRYHHKRWKELGKK